MATEQSHFLNGTVIMILFKLLIQCTLSLSLKLGKRTLLHIQERCYIWVKGLQSVNTKYCVNASILSRALETHVKVQLKVNIE